MDPVVLLLWVLQEALASCGLHPMREVGEHAQGGQTPGSLAPPGGQRESHCPLGLTVGTLGTQPSAASLCDDFPL